jgi:predicted RecB family nuclease
MDISGWFEKPGCYKQGYEVYKYTHCIHCKHFEDCLEDLKKKKELILERGE